MVDSLADDQPTSIDNSTLDSLDNQKSVIAHEFHDDSDTSHRKVNHINDTSKTKGYISIQSINFELIGPDRPTNEISS